MTQAFNLSQLANGVNTSGQLNIATYVTGTLPSANLPTVPVDKGGTGQTTYTNGQLLIGNTTGNTLTKSTLTAGTNITITNGTGSITIAAAGGSTPTGYGDIGTYVAAYGANGATYTTNSTIAGSSLLYRSGEPRGGFSTVQYGTENGVVYAYQNYAAGGWTSMGLTGTWRCMTAGGGTSSSNYYQFHLWVRVS
jgi:hypothetical protein